MPASTVAPIIVCLVGPSGSGKTVLSHLLRERGYAHIVTATTRAPRAGEENGVHYHFETPASFLAMKAAGKLVESVTIESKGATYHYGTPAFEIERAALEGQPVALVVEPQGAQNIHRYCEDHAWHCVRVFVNNPTDVLLERLEQRYQKDLAKVQAPDSPEGRAEAQKVRAAHEERVAHQIKEQDEWVRPAHDGRHPYELVLDRFDADVQDEVVARIQRIVNGLGGPTLSGRDDAAVQARPRRFGH